KSRTPKITPMVIAEKVAIIIGFKVVNLAFLSSGLTWKLVLFGTVVFESCWLLLLFSVKLLSFHTISGLLFSTIFPHFARFVPLYHSSMKKLADCCRRIQVSFYKINDCLLKLSFYVVSSKYS